MLSRASTVALALILLLPAAAFADPGRTVTATGTGQVVVKPSNRSDDASIRAAVGIARKQAIPLALADARDRAGAYAAAAGLTLGPVYSVSEGDASMYPAFAFPGGPPPFPVSIGPPGGGSFCGTLRQPVFRQVRHRRKLVRFVLRKSCFVPPLAIVTLTVTYTAG